VNGALTENRYRILTFINRCGIVTLKQLSKVFTNVSRQTLHATRKQLLELEYIEEIGFSTEKLYLITTKGTKECNYYLKGLNFNSVILNHTLIVNDILIEEILKNNNLDHFDFKTERDIKQSYYVSGTFQKDILDKIPDFIIEKNERNFAYEIELSLKKMNRLHKKISDYFDLITNETYVQVVYMCGNNEVEKHVNKAVNDVYNMKYNQIKNDQSLSFDDEILTLDLIKDSFIIEKLS